MSKLIFEKVGDVNFTYPYMVVYLNSIENPFMDIGVSDEKELEFNFYPNVETIKLSVSQWEEILAKGRDFLPRVVADEESFRRDHK